MVFVVIGTGGTGGAFLTKLARAYGQRKDVGIVAIDGDTVEEKNLLRQPFLPEDVGENKAKALSCALNQAFDSKILYSSNYINSSEDVERIISGARDFLRLLNANDNFIVLVGCVDNHAARLDIENYIKTNKPNMVLYWDSANEFSNGEIVYGGYANRLRLSPLRSEAFPSMLENVGVRRAEESCEVLNNSAPQHLAVNEMAANLMFASASQLIEQNIVPNGVVFFDVFKGTCNWRHY